MSFSNTGNPSWPRQATLTIIEAARRELTFRTSGRQYWLRHVDDFVQDTVLRILERKPEALAWPREQLAGYAKAVARNVYFAARRRFRLLPSLPESESPVDAHSADPLSMTTALDGFQQFLDWLASRNMLERRIWNQSLQGSSERQIARQEQVTRHFVRTVLSRARWRYAKAMTS